MKGVLARLRRRALRLSGDAAGKPLDEFLPAATPRRELFECIVSSFTRGYELALDSGDPEMLHEQLELIEPRWRGFAYEGAGMALWLLDSTSLGRGSAWSVFVSGPGAHQEYLLTVGAGWAMARLRQDWSRRTRALDPLLRWLALDGYGFHQGFFHWKRHHREHAAPPWNDARGRAFDQGIGRSLWFVGAAEVERVSAAVREFAEARRADVWSGIGLACAYAGGTEESENRTLLEASGVHAPHLAQGVAFAVAAREQASIQHSSTESVGRLVWGLSPEEIAELVENARAGLADTGDYEGWRTAIRASFRKSA